ncbi:MAG: hypothetical protein GY790_09105 [Bacteroidetes bacterium]|nr:hypothetical protein [Bacteroidota bacterium]
MTPFRKQITLITAALLALFMPAFAQPSIELNFQGLLTDAAGEKITSEAFDFTVKLISSDPGKTELWSHSDATYTDEYGWLTFSIPEISQHLNIDGNLNNPVVIRLEILPNSKTTWMRKGEDFMVTYTITPSTKDEVIYLKMSRMEGSELTVHNEEHLYAFKDEYPFAYLTGGFLLTDAPPLNDNAIDDLKQWISPEPDENGSATRGVKGGFPKGGYRKR